MSTIQPEALRLADMLDSDYDPDWFYEIGVDEVVKELRRLHAENSSLKVVFDEWIAKTEWVQKSLKPRELGKHRADILHARIADLEAQLASIGAGGVSPLMGEAGDAGWRDISTAPKDGRTVLVFPATWGNRTCSTAKYDPDKYAKKPRPYWDRDDAFGKVGICRERPPTHWRELPPAPSSAKGVAHG